MAILSMPATPKFRKCRFLLRGNTQQFISPLSRAIQTLELVGSKWLASYELPIMKRGEAEAWLAFLTRLNGRVGRFYGGDPSATTPRGTATGTPLVVGAGQTGITLNTDGWTAGIVPLLAGDFIAWETPTGWRELHKVVVDAGETGGGYGEGGYGEGGYGGGEATLTITPPIRESPADNATIIISSPTCVMQLVSDEEAGWDVDEALFYGVRFNAEEVFSATV